MHVKTALIVTAAAAATISAVAALATEEITYTYDAKGRVTKVVHTGTMNNGVTVQYAHDHADNRTHVTVTGAP
jgi:YD repeat-containing protein